MSIARRSIAFAMCLFALVGATRNAIAQSLYSSASVGYNSFTDLCYKQRTDSTPVVCSGTWNFNNYQSSGSGVSTATSNYGFLAVGGTAACASVNNPPLCATSASASAEFEDSLTLENLPTSQSFLNVTISAGVYTPNGKSVGMVSEVVNVNVDGRWFGCNTGQLQGRGGACSEAVAIDATNPNILIDVQLQGQAVVSSAGSAAFDVGVGKPPVPTGGTVLAIFVQDANGNRVNGVNIISGSGFSYPSYYATETRLTSKPNPSNQGQTVVFAAMPASPLPVPAGRIPSGMVSFYDGTNLLSTAQLDQNGLAKFSTSNLSTGPHQITATYDGDSFFAASTSQVLVQTVN